MSFQHPSLEVCALPDVLVLFLKEPLGEKGRSLVAVFLHILNSHTISHLEGVSGENLLHPFDPLRGLRPLYAPWS